MGTGRAVVGLSFDYHDAAAAIVVDGEIVAAAAEERFTRRKHDPSLPLNALEWALADSGVGPDDVRGVAFYSKPLTTYERIITTQARVGPKGARTLARAASVWSRSKLWVAYRIERSLRRLGYPRRELWFAEHHESHAASAFFPSPFETAAILTFDGVGEWATSSIGRGDGSRLELTEELHFPDSLGLLYSTFTAFCGFAVNDGEFKLMGLAPFGVPRFADEIRERVVNLHDDGSISLNPRYFDYRVGDRMGNRRLDDLFEGPPRDPAEPLGAREADLAASAQAVLEDVVLAMGRRAHEITGERRAVLAGGVALNCVANSRLAAEGPFDDVWVQPAAGDDGGAVGAALWAWHQVLEHPREISAGSDSMSGCFLGPRFERREVSAWLEANGVPFEEFSTAPELWDRVVAALVAGAVVGWFHGRMEFGPRALGHRSILADPRDASMVRRINEKVKQREGFRPFAPAVLAEDAAEWFTSTGASPYMMFTAPVASHRGAAPGETDGAKGTERSFGDRLERARSDIPACTHVDGSARVQTVSAESDPDFHGLLSTFAARTGCPVVLNTSFNGADEPIVRTPAEALRCFTENDLDLVVIEGCVVDRVAVGP